MRFLLSALTALSLLLASAAQAVTLIRDPDIEHALGQLARPILKAAGLSPARVKILVIQDPNLNAFVIDQDHIFIHSGMILRLENPAALQAIIAHEAAHIANGHLVRRAVNARTARNLAGLGIALAAAAAASGNGENAGLVAIGVANSARRVFMAHTRSEESSADQSGARYMARSGLDVGGAVELLEIFRGQEALSTARQDPYSRTHPMTSDRLRNAKALASTYASKARPDPNGAYWFARAQGKLSAYIRAPKWTHRRANSSHSGDIALLRKAVAFHRQSKTKQALAAMNKLMAARPKDPYLHELHGQILFESRNYKAALSAYKRAVSLAPNHALILAGYGRALLATGQHKAALSTLEKSRGRDITNVRVLRDMAQTYAKLGNNGMASLVTAERYALQGRLKDAKIHAKRASGLLPRGSGGWHRANDVLFAN